MKLFTTFVSLHPVENRRHTARVHPGINWHPFRGRGGGWVVVLPIATETVVGCGHVGLIGSAMRANCFGLSVLTRLCVHTMVPSCYF